MIELSDKQIADFWHRSYATVDGLWFMKVEEKYGFDSAVDVDDEVWQVLPKIQARVLKSIGGMEYGMNALFECLITKFDLEGFSFQAERTSTGDGFKIVIAKCPWHDVMIKSGREALSDKVNPRICSTELSVWASEFGDDIRFELEEQICKGSTSCILRFGPAPAGTP
jgi:predicted ArsR family transcriptional regulator